MALTKRISILLLAAAPVWSTVYYVDNVNGADGNAGTTATAAWQTLSRVSQSNLNPGDFVLLRRGQVWHEQLIIPASGTPDQPITFGAFGRGSGAPVIDGAGVTVQAQQGLVNADKQSNLVIQDLEIRFSSRDGILPYQSNNLAVRNCTVHDNQFNGVLVYDGNNIVIDGSTFYNNSLDLSASYAGIAIDGAGFAMQNVTVSNNSIHDNIGGEGWLGANGINLGHTGPNIPTITNVLITGNDIFGNGNPDQNQAGRGISASFNGDVAVIKNRVYQNASAGVYLGDIGLTLAIVISQNTFRNNALRQFGGITNGSGLAQQNLVYVDDPTITGMGAEIGGNGPWTIQNNVFCFFTPTTDQFRGFIRINDPVQDGLLQSNNNEFYSAGPNRFKRSDGVTLSFQRWQSFGYDPNSVNPH